MTLDANIINYSPLPFYKSADGQNAKRWWVYDIYPLFASNKSLIPFQIIREHHAAQRIAVQGIVHYESCIEDWGIGEASRYNERVFEFSPSQFDGTIIITSDGKGEETDSSKVIIFQNANGAYFTNVEAVQANTNWEETSIDVTIPIPSNAVKIFVSSEVSTNIYRTDYANAEIHTENGATVASFRCKIKRGDNYDIIIGMPSGLSLPLGRYYLIVKDEFENEWISDILTVVEDDFLVDGNYIKMEWYDQQDLVADSGMISYADGYKNIIYIRSDLAKPEYVYEEDGENRDGYFFPEKQISKKRYKFGFLAPEYLLDVLRLVRLSDYAKITYKGREYQCSEILITPTWESEGDLASVAVEFDTNTVIKAVGRIL